MTSDNFVPVWRKGTTILFVMVLGGLFIYLCSCASLQIWPFCLCLRLPQIALLSRLHPRVPNLVRPISHLILEPLVHGLLHLFSSQGPVHAARASSSSPALIRVLRLNTVDLHLTADEQKKNWPCPFDSESGWSFETCYEGSSFLGYSHSGWRCTLKAAVAQLSPIKLHTTKVFSPDLYSFPVPEILNS